MWRSLNEMGTSQAESNQDALDQPEIAGGDGIYQDKWVILNPVALHRISALARLS
jgi:hypothetical protein